VKLYSNSNFASPGAGVAITTTADNPSTLFGARILIDDLDGDGKNELIVSDPATAVGSVSDAGKIYIYTRTARARPLAARCASRRPCGRPKPATTNHYGRALATTTYKTAKGTRKILGVGERNRLNVYFRVNATATDPARALVFSATILPRSRREGLPRVQEPVRR